jgi:hypothetical protein
MCGRSSDRQHDLTSERFPATQDVPEVPVSQTHTLLLDFTATWFGTVPQFARTSSPAGAVTSAVDTGPGAGRAHERDRCRDRRVPSDAVIAAT